MSAADGARPVTLAGVRRAIEQAREWHDRGAMYATPWNLLRLLEIVAHAASQPEPATQAQPWDYAPDGALPTQAQPANMQELLDEQLKRPGLTPNLPVNQPAPAAAVLPPEPRRWPLGHSLARVVPRADYDALRKAAEGLAREVKHANTLARVNEQRAQKAEAERDAEKARADAAEAALAELRARGAEAVAWASWDGDSIAIRFGETDGPSDMEIPAGHPGYHRIRRIVLPEVGHNDTGLHPFAWTAPPLTVGERPDAGRDPRLEPLPPETICSECDAHVTLFLCDYSKVWRAKPCANCRQSVPEAHWYVCPACQTHPEGACDVCVELPARPAPGPCAFRSCGRAYGDSIHHVAPVEAQPMGASR